MKILIRLGLSEVQKQNEIIRYVKNHDVKEIIVFSPQKFLMDMPGKPIEQDNNGITSATDTLNVEKTGDTFTQEKYMLKIPEFGEIPIRQIEYKEVIMYRTFYPLLEEIDKDYLLVVNEFMRTKNRSDLTYNCLRHYLNQCGHQIIFEYFPFIEDVSDFMILLDFDTKSKHKGSSFSKDFLYEEDIRAINPHLELSVDTIELPVGAEEEYEKEKNKLFNSIGNKSPDTIPRQLHIYCGKWKKPYIVPEKQYVARNARYHMKNVTTYPNVKHGVTYELLDWQHRRLDMNDFFRRTGQSKITFISTGLSVDEVYVRFFNEWKERLEEFYAEAGVFSENR